jgi:NTP pyrophosphatase (non-canonical NTP hydrolase)
MKETQKTISEWGAETFGYPVSVKAIVDRMLKEAKELEEFTTHVNFENKGSYEEIADECADIYIVMCQVMNVIGYNLHACVDHKMQINRARKWQRLGDGTGQHIKE